MRTTVTSAAEIGPILRTLRLNAGLSVEQLAARARVSYATVSFCENGRRIPHTPMLLLLLSVLGAELSISERLVDEQAALAEALLVS